MKWAEPEVFDQLFKLPTFETQPEPEETIEELLIKLASKMAAILPNDRIQGEAVLKLAANFHAVACDFREKGLPPH